MENLEAELLSQNSNEVYLHSCRSILRRKHDLEEDEVKFINSMIMVCHSNKGLTKQQVDGINELYWKVYE